jgi:hypothetical protein
MQRTNIFMNDFYPKIDGWLYQGAIELTEMLLNAQKSAGIIGGGLEIGVYKAKYLSFLASTTDYNWVGLDVFIFDQQSEAAQNIETVLGSDKIRVKLVQGNTQTMTSDELTVALTKNAVGGISFASIDGDHSCKGVTHDLKIVEKNLVPGGIIAVDDLFSPMCASVSEGFFKYMQSDDSNLKPIAYSDNKLFMTTSGYDELYQIRVMIAASLDDGLCGQRWKDGTQINRVRPFLDGRLIHF